MTTIEQLQVLADELTDVFPPPKVPLGVNSVIAGTGKWRVMRIGGGCYAVRIEYQRSDGTTVTVKSSEEIVGYPSNVTTAIRFALQMGNASRHFWLPLG